MSTDSGPSRRVAQPRQRCAKSGARIAAITTLSGRSYAGRMFIDATYEGDLMAAAGVSIPSAARRKHLRREVERRADRRAPSSPSLRRAVRDDQPLCGPGRPEERAAAACQRRAARRVRPGRQADPGLLLPDVPDRSPGQPHSVSRSPKATTRASTNCCCGSSRRAGGRPSRSSTRFRTARPTPTITARSAPTTSG